jgi:hypothetical protein
MRVNNEGVATAPVSEWNYDMGAAPAGAKMLLLTKNGIAVLGHVSGETRKGYMAWAALPRRNKEIERAGRSDS